MSETEVKRVPVVIVGSGPAGLTAAIYAGRAGLRPVIAAGGFKGASQVPGGQLMITTEVENFPGFPEGIEGPELMNRFTEQAKRFGAELIESWATNFELPQGGPFRLKIGEEQYECGTLILANGASAKWLGAPDEEKYRNRGISGCATCDGPLPFFRNKHICVLGGGDTAMEEASFLSKFASKVSIIVRSHKLRASKIMQKRVHDNPKIEIVWNTAITGYRGVERLEALVVQDTITGESREIPCGGLFMAIGHEPNTSHLRGSGLEMDDQGYIVVRNSILTNIDGVFAAGDVHDKNFRQAVSAAGFGCMAAIAAERWLEEKHASQ